MGFVDFVVDFGWVVVVGSGFFLLIGVGLFYVVPNIQCRIFSGAFS